MMNKNLIAICFSLFASNSIVHADEFHFQTGINQISYQRPGDNIWYDAPYLNMRTVRNYGISIGVIKNISDNISIRIGYFRPETHTVHSEIPSDSYTSPGAYCMSNCGTLGTILVKTKTQGIYFIASPEYGDRIKIFADIGGWYFHQTVDAFGINIPAGFQYRARKYWYQTSSINAIRKIIGGGIKIDSWNIAIDHYDAFGDKDALPPGFDGTFTVFTISKTW